MNLSNLFTAKASRAQTYFWFGLSLVFAALYASLVLRLSFSSPYIVQDDARQHVFWMFRFIDPALFPNDLIADYFQSVAPEGYTTFYRCFISLGIDPILINKILPLILGVVAAGWTFGIALHLLPIPATAFLSSLLLSQHLWAQDDLASATPRAFMPVIFLGFVYFLLKRSLLPCLVAIALQGLFYPQFVFVCSGLLVLQPIRWHKGRLRLSGDRSDYWFSAAGLAVAFLVMLPFALSTSEYGPVITAAEARKLPEFTREGRSPFFLPYFSSYWFSGQRSGIMPTIQPPYIVLGVLLPFLLRYPNRFPLTQQISDQIGILVRWAIVAVTLFFAAHLLLFRLHLPTRYSSFNLQMVLILSAGITTAVLLDAGLRWLSQASFSRRQKQLLLWVPLVVLAIYILSFPKYDDEFPKPELRVATHPRVYEFLSQQPKDTLVAALNEEADFIPTFAKRSVLVAEEYAVPYHVGYSNQFRRNAEATIRAFYTSDLSTLQAFIRDYGIDFFVISPSEFQLWYLRDMWVRQYPQVIQEARANIEQTSPVLKRLAKRCAALSDAPITVVSARCILNSDPP